MPPTRRRSPTRSARFIHGPEVDLLTVQLDTPFELGFDCGFEAQSCYFGGENKIVLSGDDDPAPDSASRDFVLAHEYGHHVAQHRDMPSPFPAAINWGTERWSSVEDVCEGHRAGAFFPGDEGTHYYEDPGEAFAESFAFNRYPEAAVKWAWAPALRPTPASLQALRDDTLRPWLGRHSFTVSGHVPRDAASSVQEFRTPFDGRVSIEPAGDRTARLRADHPQPRRQDPALLAPGRLAPPPPRLHGLWPVAPAGCGPGVGRAGKPFRLTIQRP